MTTTDETILNGTSDDWQTQTYEVNWEQLTLEELTKGYMRQSDYTRKTQELKAQAKQTDEIDEDDSWVDAVKWKGFITQEDLDREVAKRLQSRDFEDTLSVNPDLKKFWPAIKELAERTWKSYEAVIDEYWFGSSDKLKKAKETKLLGDREYGSKEKPISEMNSDEYSEWKKKNWMIKWSILREQDKIL